MSEKLFKRAGLVNLKKIPDSELAKTDVFLPSIIKSGFSQNDARALLEACIKYGWAQTIEDKIITKNDYLKIRLLENIDFTIDEDNNILSFGFKDKTVIIFGLYDETKKQEPYPIKKIGLERYQTKVIDIVDVEDLYHSNYISFLTPVLYRKGNKCAITFDGVFTGSKKKKDKQIPDTLKIMGLVFFK